MKFTAATIVTAVALLVSSLVSADYGPAKVHLDCPNVVWEQLTLQEEEYAASILMTAYNQVHQQTDGGDRYLASLHFNSTGAPPTEEGMLGRIAGA
jgi:hypothetical protein